MGARLSCILLFASLSVSAAQSLTAPAPQEYLKGYVTDTRSLFSAPARWGLPGWSTAAGISALAGLSIAFADEPVTDAFQRNRNDGTETAALLLEPLGDGLWTLPGLALFYGGSYLGAYDKGKAVSLAALQSFLTAGAITHVSKQVFHRHRPKTGDGPHEFDGPAFSQYNLSLPSGHTTAAFSIASVFATAYCEQPWVPVLSYALAAGTGLSRIHDNKHWLSDVFIGAVIGTCTGRHIVKAWEKRNAEKVQVSIRANNLTIGYSF